MRKFMIVQLGLILALASSSALAAGAKPEAIADKGSAHEVGRNTTDKKLKGAKVQVGAAQAGAVNEVKNNLREDEGSGKREERVLTQETKQQEVKVAKEVCESLQKILNEAKVGDQPPLGYHTEAVRKILDEPANSDIAMLSKFERISKETGIAKDKLEKNCKKG